MAIEKYRNKSPSELRGTLEQRDARISRLRKDCDEQLEGAKVRRYYRAGSAGLASVLAGYLFQRKPELKSFAGLPIGLDHVVAIGGVAMAMILAESEPDSPLSDAAEGVAMSGLVPVLRSAGDKLARTTI